MIKEELKNFIAAEYTSAEFDETAEWMTVNISPSEWEIFSKWLKESPELNFDFLFCITCVDWRTHLSMVYHLTSTIFLHTLIVKIKVDDRNNPEVPSVAHRWRTAEFHEREAYDLFGMKFSNHPDLRRIFLTDDWQGWPLRKDYEDSVNMIKL
jgi:NADH-quinone oxidoreductase subunit C